MFFIFINFYINYYNLKKTPPGGGGKYIYIYIYIYIGTPHSYPPYGGVLYIPFGGTPHTDEQHAKESQARAEVQVVNFIGTL